MAQQLLMAKLAFSLLLLLVLAFHHAEGDDEPSPDPEPRTEKQWAAMEINYIGSGSLVVMNADLKWGKWYDYPNKDKEISTINGVVIPAGVPVVVAASGRASATSGTEGSYELYSGATKVAKIEFDCPYIGSNSLGGISSGNSIVEVPSVSKSGPIGYVKIKVGYFGVQVIEQA